MALLSKGLFLDQRFLLHRPPTVVGAKKAAPFEFQACRRRSAQAGEFGGGRILVFPWNDLQFDVITTVDTFCSKEEAMVALKLRLIGNSTGLTIPKETLAQFNLKEGDTLYLTPAPGGMRLTPYDPDFEDQMEAARAIMKKRRNALRELAK
jgi:putative addiction module antidote